MGEKRGCAIELYSKALGLIKELTEELAKRPPKLIITKITREHKDKDLERIKRGEGLRNCYTGRERK
jgi:hypothetical protein